MKVTRSHRVLLGGFMLLVVAAVGGGIAYATIPDQAGVLHGCYSPNGAKQANGTQLNVIDRDSASCNKNQVEVTWNQTGPPGADGADESASRAPRSARETRIVPMAARSSRRPTTT